MSKTDNVTDKATSSKTSKTSKTLGETEIVNVWHYNLVEEMENVCKLVEQGFNTIAMDTEFPGIIYSNTNSQLAHLSSWYDNVRNNVNVLNLIQVGITLSDDQGNKPEPVNTWQFNLQFDLDNDQFANDSIAILKEAGIDFEELMVSFI